jgi:hypothetical protein
LANELGLAVTACRLPSGTSKWSRIEHRLFSSITQISSITQNWRGKPLVSHQAIGQLISVTTTDADLKVRCEIDKSYPARVKPRPES